MPLILLALLHPINDITTTPDAPPVMSFAYPAENKAKQEELYPDLKPLISKESPSELFARAKAVAETQSHWQIVHSEGLRLEVVVTSTLWHFKDDVVIEVRPETEGSSLHMRSRSRVGRSDLGANYKRIRAFFKKLG